MAWPRPEAAPVDEAPEAAEAPEAPETAETTLGGARGGLWPLALGPVSALLMVAAVWLEYPESLWRSLWTPFPDGGDLSWPTSGLERLAATLAFSLETGDRRRTTSSSSVWQSSTVAWKRGPAMTATGAERPDGGGGGG
jgi:hypothetical protein